MSLELHNNTSHVVGTRGVGGFVCANGVQELLDNMLELGILNLFSRSIVALGVLIFARLLRELAAGVLIERLFEVFGELLVRHTVLDAVACQDHELALVQIH